MAVVQKTCLNSHFFLPRSIWDIYFLVSFLTNPRFFYRSKYTKKDMEEEKKETIVLSDMETRVREIQTPSSLPRIAFSIKKTERVVSAIHLLTDRLDASNSFKEHIRNCSLSFLSLISYGTENESVRRQLSSLFSLIRVGNLSGFFSNSQADLINGELLQIWSAIYPEIFSIIRQDLKNHFCPIKKLMNLLLKRHLRTILRSILLKDNKKRSSF